MNLENKVIVVIGGLGLIGKEFVKAIEENNGIAIVADLNIQSENDVFINITEKKSITEAIEKLDKKYGKIDAIVNTSYPRNKNYGRDFFNVEYSDFCDMMDTNIGGYFLVSQVFSDYFVKQGYGNIINLASIYGVVPPKFDIYDNTDMTNPIEYAPIKAGIIHLTKYLATYLKDKNIRVNAISPGGIFNNQDPEFLEKYKKHCINKGMLDATDLNGLLLFLLSDSSKYLNGQNIILDDGFTL